MNVQLLTIEQEGAYIRLLAFCWREGKVPNDDARLASLCKGVSSSVLIPVKELFQLSDCGNFLIHKRLESERKKQKKWKEKSSEAGKKSAIVRKAKKESNLNLNQPSTKPQPTTQPNGNSAFASSSSTSSVKKEQKTSLRQAQSDPRHVPFKLACETYAKYKGVEFVWDGGEAKQLAALLAASPGLTLGVFQQCLNHRAKSQVPHGERPREWLGTILKYQEGPLDQYGKPQGASNGNRNQSKTGGNIDAAKQALAILAEAERNSSLADEMQSQAGCGDQSGDLSHLRTGSIEL